MIALNEPKSLAHPWDRAAAGWNDHTRIIREWLREPTQMMLDAGHVKPGSRVLDIAAGAGDQTLDIARRVGENGYVLATDISTRILELAQHNASAQGFAHVETRVADAHLLNLDGANFDAAVCRLGLMFCHDPLAALKSARAALKPGGRFSALAFSGPQNNPCLAITLRTALKHAGSASEAQSAFTPGTLMSLGKPGLFARLLHDAGFVDIDVQRVSAPFYLPTKRHYIDFLRSAASPVIEIVAPLSINAQRAAWDDIETQLNVFTTPAGWVGPNELLLATATGA